jgi:hypothetical protein
MGDLSAGMTVSALLRLSDFLCPGQPRHTDRPEHSLTAKVSLGSPAGGRRHLAMLAGSADL